jgi:hypothetical protein
VFAPAYDRRGPCSTDQLEQPAPADGLVVNVATGRRDGVHDEHHTKRFGRWGRYSDMSVPVAALW